MAGILSLFFTWPAECCGTRDGPAKLASEFKAEGEAPIKTDKHDSIKTDKHDSMSQSERSAIWAVTRLVPDMKFKEGTEFFSERWGGNTGAAHKVTLIEDPSRAFFVKVEALSVKVRRDLMNASSAGITPKVLGSDGGAIVQEFWTASPFPQWGELLELPEERRLAEAAKIGRLTAKIHKLSVPPGAVMHKPCKSFWTEMPRHLMKFRASNPTLSAQLLKVLDYVDRRPFTEGVGGKAGGPVFTHGDWRAMNTLVDTKGDVFLCDLDGRKVDTCNRAADLAAFFWCWDLYDENDKDYAKGTGSYPSLTARRALAGAYLSEAGLPADEEAVDDLLWEVEYEILRSAMVWIAYLGMHSDLFDWKRTIPYMETVLCEALSGNRALKERIVEFGLMSGAHQRKLGEHIPEEDGNARLRSQV